MEEKELKTSLKARIFIILIAVFMVGSVVASYAGIILAGSGNSDGNSQVDPAKITELEMAYSEKEAEFAKATEGDFNEFIKYKSEIKAYNETAANENGIQVRDLKAGSGRKLGEGDTDYLAYYVGWCPDETVFDSSFDNNATPTAFTKILDASLGMIEGWNLGVEGMKIDGVREVTIPGELAYGSAMEICGGYNKPLKFLIMVKAKAEPLLGLSRELDAAFMKLQYASYGIDYDEVKGME